MTLLLDTHALLWWLADDPALTPAACTAIRATGTLVFVSAATAWEISIKQALGKLEAPDDLEAALAASQFQPLPIMVAHALAAGRLPRHHDDPFDRMLIAQAQHAQLTVVTHDPKFRLSDVAILWTCPRYTPIFEIPLDDCTQPCKLPAACAMHLYPLIGL